MSWFACGLVGDMNIFARVRNDVAKSNRLVGAESGRGNVRRKMSGIGIGIIMTGIIMIIIMSGIGIGMGIVFRVIIIMTGIILKVKVGLGWI